MLTATSSVPATNAEEPPAWQAPSETETKALAALQGRLLHRKYGKAVLADPKNKLPPVDEALGTLDKTLELKVRCESSTLTVRVKTEFKAWNAAFTGGEAAGFYVWGGIKAEADEAGNADFVNVLMIDPGFIESSGKSVYGQADAVRMLYHELLHAQLLLDAIKRDKAWAADFCRTQEPDYGPADLADPHRVIPAYDKKFLDELWARVQNENKPWSQRE